MLPIVRISLPSGNTTLVGQFHSQEANISNFAQVFKNPEQLGILGFQTSHRVGEVVAPLNGSYGVFDISGYPGFVSRQLSDNGHINVALAFTVIGDVPKSLYFTFDMLSGEYATLFTLTNDLNGKVIVVNNQSVLKEVDITSMQITEGTTITMTILGWSASPRSVKVASISATPTLVISKDLVSIDCSENLMDSEMSLTPGVCEQYASIELYDRGLTLHTLGMNGQLHKDYVIDISVMHNGKHYSLGNYVSESWDTLVDSAKVTIHCRDKTYLFDSINVSSPTMETRTLDALLNILFSQTNVSWTYLDDETAQRCQEIFIEHNWFANSNLKTLLDKICIVGMLRMYWYMNTFIIGRCA